MSAPKGFFDREPTIRDMDDVWRVLAERTQGKIPAGGSAEPIPLPPMVISPAVAATSPILQWLPPETLPDGDSRRLSGDQQFSVLRLGVTPNYRYIAFRHVPAPTRCLGGAASFVEAEALCRSTLAK